MSAVVGRTAAESWRWWFSCARCARCRPALVEHDVSPAPATSAATDN
ncbi:hypothetical protein M8494_10555 [Serratia ureilytica]